MADENIKICDIVKKCKILLLDIEGTTTSISFVKDKLFPYAEENLKEFLENQWDSDDVKEVVEQLRKLAIEDKENNVEGVVAIPGEDAPKDEQIEGLVNNVKWQMSADRKVAPLKQLQGLIWKKGYDKGDIKGHVYDDVSPALEQWRSVDGQKVYIYSSGSVQAQKLLFGQSTAGDLLPQIEGHFDTAVGAKQEAPSYAIITEKIGCKPEEILFLTDIVKEAEAARASGLQAALVSREGNAPLPPSVDFPVLHSFDELTPTNKRKPNAQEPEIPAKIPKTDIEDNVKTAAEAEEIQTTDVETKNKLLEPVTLAEKITSPKPVVATLTTIITEIETVAKGSEDTENMEVEEEVPIVENSKQEQTVNAKQSISKTVVVEEVTDSNDVADTPVCDIEPIIEEIGDKTETKETEKMDTDSTENGVDTTAEKENIATAEEVIKNAAENVTASVVTEIQEVTNNQQTLNEMVEIIDGLEPVIEEPSAIEMDELKNVGEVLEKECDEILSKVQDVTNLDNIPVKPMLNTIDEEPLDPENGENTNDIVEKILDREMELGLNSCEATNPDGNTEQDFTDCKLDKNEVETQAADIQKELESNEIEKIIEVKAAECVVEENKVEDSVEDKSKIPEKIAEESKVPETIAEEKISENDVEESKVPETITEEKISECDTEEIKVAPTISNDKKEMETSSEDRVTETSSQDKSNKEVKETADIIIKENTAADPIPQEKPTAKIEDTKELENMKPENTKEVNTPLTNGDSQESSSTEVMETDGIITSHVETGTNNVESNDSSIKKDESIKETKEISVNPEKDLEEKIESKTEKIEYTESITKTVNNVDSQNKGITDPSLVAESASDSDTKSDGKEIETQEKMDIETAEKQINGKTTNNETQTNLNGDASKQDELNARLSVENVENGKEMNGANGNGDSVDVEMGQGDNKVVAEIPDIKVKSVVTDEPRTDPIEQPTKA